KATSLVLLLIIAGLIATIVYLYITGGTQDRFTEFYLLNQEGNASDYPAEMIAGQPSAVMLGIVNHEGKPVDYTIQVIANGVIINSVKTGILLHNQKWEQAININMNSAGNNQTIMFFLSMNGDAVPHIKDPLVLNTNVITSE
ncbi:MAG: DUF1616 domain-containing protein, partial [Dehalococcoidia bacterium]|nr:DUF1616 domain-containing protein [Dehalococcoidia bacterium]